MQTSSGVSVLKRPRSNLLSSAILSWIRARWVAQKTTFIYACMDKPETNSTLNIRLNEYTHLFRDLFTLLWLIRCRTGCGGSFSLSFSQCPFLPLHTWHMSLLFFSLQKPLYMSVIGSPCFCLTSQFPVRIVGKHSSRNLTHLFFFKSHHCRKPIDLTLAHVVIFISQSWASLHLSCVFSSLLILFLFPVFKRPLVVKSSHYTLMNLLDTTLLHWIRTIFNV